MGSFSNSQAQPSMTSITTPHLTLPNVPDTGRYSFPTLLFGFLAEGVVLPPIWINPQVEANSDTVTPTTLDGTNPFPAEPPAPSTTSPFLANDLNSAAWLSILQPESTTVSSKGLSKGGSKVNGTMTLAYMACQMLPGPMHLTLVTASLKDAAVEYFSDQDCGQFVMTTVGTRINVNEAEEEAIQDAQLVEMMRANPEAAASAGHEESARLEVKGLLANFPTQPILMVKSVRWVGLVSPAEFSLSKAKHGHHHHQGHHNGHDREMDSHHHQESKAELDEKKEEQREQEEEEQWQEQQQEEELAQEAEQQEPDPNDGYVSWDRFLETELQAPLKTMLEPLPTDKVDTPYRIGAPDTTGATLLSTGVTTAETTPAGGVETSRTLGNATSQIVMAGLVAGLILLLGSAIMAVYYRKRRRRWYEEDGDV